LQKELTRFLDDRKKQGLTPFLALSTYFVLRLVRFTAGGSLSVTSNWLAAAEMIASGSVTVPWAL